MQRYVSHISTPVSGHEVISKRQAQDLRSTVTQAGKRHSHCHSATVPIVWAHDLKRLELGYEDEGCYNFRLQLGQPMQGPK